MLIIRKRNFFQVQDNSNLAPLESTIFPPLDCRADFHENSSKMNFRREDLSRVPPITLSLASKENIMNWERGNIPRIQYIRPVHQGNSMLRRIEEIPPLSQTYHSMHWERREIPETPVHPETSEGIPLITPLSREEKTGF